MAKQFTVKLEAVADDIYELSVALDHASGQIADGYTSGDLRNASISFGTWSIKEEQVCEECGGLNGEHDDITTMESVDPSEPHLQAPVGTAKCPMAD